MARMEGTLLGITRVMVTGSTDSPQVGDVYFNSVDQQFCVWTGERWTPMSASISGAFLPDATVIPTAEVVLSPTVDFSKRRMKIRR